VVIVVGDVNADEVYALAQKYFAPLPREKISTVAPRPETEQRGIKHVTVKRPAELPYLLMGYKTPSLMIALNNPDQVPDWEPYALEVLSGVLDGGDSARFNSNLVRGREIAASVGLDYSLTSRLGDLLVIDAVPAGKHTMPDLEQAIREEIEKVRNEPISAEELERVKVQVIAADIFQRDSLFFQAMIMGIFESVGLSWNRIDEYVERVKAVTAEQVQQVAKKYLIDDNLTVGVLEPLPLDGATVRPHSGVSEHVR
ncbi:MAG: M16 family metallopeptidase, partial [Gammaproteobacteria bacterium]